MGSWATVISNFMLVIALRLSDSHVSADNFNPEWLKLAEMVKSEAKSFRLVARGQLACSQI